MSFEAVSNIAQAEAQAKVTVAEAESKAKQMLADADTAGKLAIDAACAKAEEELKELTPARYIGNAIAQAKRI